MAPLPDSPISESIPDPDHSARSARIGSTRATRRAGHHDATTAR